jgi:pSer/pThr/pTyr-binding forkhead associated (FHA) protein
VGRRLIVKHGERVTRHELTDKAIVIGRDPSCDLFFADQKLSRRHARVEPADEGVRLVDLGSRNGSWVNEQSVEEHLLQPEDEIRLGRLYISFEEDLPSPPPEVREDATVVLPDTTPRVDDAGRTMRMEIEALEAEHSKETPPPDDTVLFGGAPTPDKDGTVVLPATSPPEESSGTVIFQQAAESEVDTTTEAVPVSDGAEPSTRSQEVTLEPQLPPTIEAPVAGRAQRASVLPILVLGGLSLVAYALLAVPLIYTTRHALREESLARGRTITRLLATQNQILLGARRHQDLSSETASAEPGVDQALILDLDGRILVPFERAGEPLGTIEGLPGDLSEVEGFQSGRTASGAYNMVAPLTHEGQRVGYAVITYSLVELAERGAVSALVVLGFLLITGGIWGGFALSKRLMREQVDTEITLSDEPSPDERGLAPGVAAAKTTEAASANSTKEMPSLSETLIAPPSADETSRDPKPEN